MGLKGFEYVFEFGGEAAQKIDQRFGGRGLDGGVSRIPHFLKRKQNAHIMLK